MRILIIFFSFCILFLGEQHAHAFEFIFTPTVSYTNHKGLLNDIDFDDTAPLSYNGASHFSGWMYGGGMTFVFNKYVALSMSYQYGKLGTEHSGSFTESNNYYDQVTLQSAYCHNAYSAFVFPVSGHVKLFAGMRYLPTIYKARQSGAISEISGSNNRYGIYTSRLESRQFRPLAGLGFSVPFARYFGFTLSLSGQYVFGEMECLGHAKEYPSADLTGIASEQALFDYTLKLRGWGGEVEPAFIGFINDSVWIVAGFRYRYTYMHAEGKSGNTDIDYSGLSEHTYGVLFSLVSRM